MKKCEFCGELLKRRVYPSGQIERPGVYEKRRFCSRQCALAFRHGKDLITRSADIVDEVQRENLTPLEYMLRVMNNPNAPPERRDKCAIAAAPFVHRKPGGTGKKHQQAEAAKEATQGKFAPMKAPKRVDH
nr:hypothetical protein [uncultured Desulfobulbus sp.]